MSTCQTLDRKSRSEIPRVGRGLDAGYEGGVLDETLVALGGEEIVCYGGVVAEDFLGCLRMDLTCYALVAEGSGGGLLEAWWLRSLDLLVKLCFRDLIESQVGVRRIVLRLRLHK